MKKTLKSTRFWTILSSMLLISSFWLVVYALPDDPEGSNQQSLQQNTNVDDTVDGGWGRGNRWGSRGGYSCQWSIPAHAIDNNSNRPINSNQQTRRCTDSKSQSACTFRCVNGYQCSADGLSCVQTPWATPWSTEVAKIFEKYKNSKKNSPELQKEEWDEIMDKLQNLIIPPHAIMAFNAADWKCPEWWTRFTAADGRFLRWATSNIWKLGWNNNNLVLIKAENLPAHSHYIRYWNTRDDYWDNANRRAVVVDWNTKKFPRDPEKSSNHGMVETDSYSIHDVSTAPIWKDWCDNCGLESNRTNPGGTAKNLELDVTNAYVNVVYCEKLPL